MRVHEIMTRSVRSIAPGTEAESAWQLMRKEHVHHLIVMNGNRVLGVLSEVDVGGERGAVVRAGKQVDELMTRDVVTVSPDDTVRRAANLLRGNGVGSLPVVEGSKLVGMVTTTDMLDMIGRGMEQVPRESERWTMHARGPRKSMGHRALKAAARFGRAR